jgi:hypothetical protein
MSTRPNQLSPTLGQLSHQAKALIESDLYAAREAAPIEDRGSPGQALAGYQINCNKCYS